MIKYKYLVALLFVIHLMSLSAISQNRDAVLKKLVKQYSAPLSLQYNTTYNLYKTIGSNTIYETYKGNYVKNTKGSLYFKINDTDFYANKEYNLQVNHTQKIILITKANPEIKNDFDVEKLLSSFNKGSFIDKGAYWEIELVAKPLTSLPYSKIVLYIGKDYFLKKQKFFYNTAVDFSTVPKKTDFQYPVLEIIYGKHTRNEPPATYFDISRYVLLRGKGVQLNQKFRQYELIDRR